MKSWKTTVGGLLAALGAALMGFGSESLKLWGAAATALGVAILGVSARDNNKNSEDVGAK